jgi:hypothetical protein
MISSKNFSQETLRRILDEVASATENNKALKDLRKRFNDKKHKK